MAAALSKAIIVVVSPFDLSAATRAFNAFRIFPTPAASYFAVSAPMFVRIALSIFVAKRHLGTSRLAVLELRLTDIELLSRDELPPNYSTGCVSIFPPYLSSQVIFLLRRIQPLLAQKRLSS